jgi:hypothetical protein
MFNLINFGACHGCELTYALGFYSEDYSYLGWGIMPQEFTDEEIAMGDTMKSYWTNMFYDADPGTVSGVAWSPITLTERHMIVFKASYSGGAAVDPCIDTLACRVEPTNDYRAAEAGFWQDLRNLWHWFGPGPEDATVCTAGTSGPTMEAWVDHVATCDSSTEYVYADPADSLLYGSIDTPDPSSYNGAGTYSAPAGTYTAPAPEAPYTAPEVTYTAPEATYTAPDETYEAPDETYEAPVAITEDEETDDDDSSVHNRVDDLVADWKDVDHALGLAAAALAVGVLALLTACMICCCGMMGGAYFGGKGGSGGGKAYPDFNLASAGVKTEDV